MSVPYKHLLNMENLEPVTRLVKELSQNIEKNEEVLASISRCIDSRINLPRLPAEDESEPEESKPNDCLRALIDSKYLPQIASDTAVEREKFAIVQNPQLRQLLSDNEALLRLHKAKCEKNKQLYKVYQDYDGLIRAVVLPQLTKVVCDYNVEKVVDMRENTLREKLELDGKVWKKYAEYVENLDKIYAIVSVLIDTLHSVVDGKEIQRLEQQLLILGRLTEVAKNKTRDFRRPLTSGRV